jgi:hypothetical protein
MDRMNRLTFCVILLHGLCLSIASVSAKSPSVNAVTDTFVLHKGTPAQRYKETEVTGVKAFSLSTPRQSEKANANLPQKT